MTVLRGRQFLAIPGPTNIPDRVLRAMDRPAVDFKSAGFHEIELEIFAGLKKVFQTEHTVFAYPSAGRGAWEAAMVNTLSPGDKILVAETGAFSVFWREIAKQLGLDVEELSGDWRHGGLALRCWRTRRAHSKSLTMCTSQLQRGHSDV